MKRTCLIASAFLVAVGMPLTTLATTPAQTACEIPTNSQVQSLFDQWNAALKTRNPQKIASLYADNSVLLPTLSNTPRTNHKELEGYFKYFVRQSPSGKIDSRIIRSGCNWATDNGIYTFTFNGDTPKEKHVVTARFSFTYEYIDGKWLIVTHHSSLLPNDKNFEEDKQEMSKLER